MYKKMLFQLLISLICLTFTQAYFPKQLIPKRLRVKMCEKNPTLSICDSLIDSPKYFPFDQYSKWDICKFRTDLSFCRRFPVKLFETEFKNEEIIPLKSYESSRESNGFVEPTISTENITKVTKMFNSIKVCF
uniref:Uncharacterized protein n=1 Tax=Panagrolaimus sp. PS1159 TaxID=55785 RepID=A0AC35EV60_9BILA